MRTPRRSGSAPWPDGRFVSDLYIHCEAVIPAHAGIQLTKTGFRVKPGMTIKLPDLRTLETNMQEAIRAYLRTVEPGEPLPDFVGT